MYLLTYRDGEEARRITRATRQEAEASCDALEDAGVTIITYPTELRPAVRFGTGRNFPAENKDAAKLPGAEAFRVRDHTTVVIPDGFHIKKLPAMKAAGLGHPKSSGGLGMAIGTRGFGASYTGAKVRQNNASKR